MPVERQTRRDLASIILAAGLVLFPVAARMDLFNPDEPREAEIAREMREARDLLVPTFNGCPFLEKPPLFYWSVLAASAIPGVTAELGARLPSILAAIGLLLLVYFLGRELYDRRTGRAASLILLTTFQFWWLGWRALLDMTLAFFVGAVLLTYLLAERRPAERARWLLLAGLSAAGAAMTKGAIGLVIPGATIVTWHLWRREPKSLLRVSLLAAGLIPLAALGLWCLLLALRPEGACLVREFLIENHVKRFLGGGYGGHHRPLWYYLESLATDMQPWVLFLPAAFIALWPGWRPVSSGRPGSYARDPFLHAWLVPGLLLLSLASTKRSIYLLPLSPAIALLIAAWWRTTGRGVDSRSSGTVRIPGPVLERDAPRRSPSRFRWSVFVPCLFLLALGLLVAILIPAAIAVLLTGRDPRGAADILAAVRAEPSGIPMGVALACGVVAVSLLTRFRRSRGACAALALVWVFFLAVGAAILPLAQGRLSARWLGEAIHVERARGTIVAASGLREGALGQFLFYSGGTLEWIGREQGTEQTPCTECRSDLLPAEFLSGPGPRACLLPVEAYEELPEQLRRGRILARGKIGGASYVLLSSAYNRER